MATPRNRATPRKRATRWSIDTVLKRLRGVDPPTDRADIVVAVRMKLAPDGQSWEEPRWNAHHYVEFEPGQEPPRGCLHPTVAVELSKLFAYEAAKSRGGDFAARIGASVGEGALEKLAELFPEMFNRKD